MAEALVSQIVVDCIEYAEVQRYKRLSSMREFVAEIEERSDAYARLDAALRYGS